MEQSETFLVELFLESLSFAKIYQSLYQAGLSQSSLVAMLMLIRYKLQKKEKKYPQILGIQ